MIFTNKILAICVMFISLNFSTLFAENNPTLKLYSDEDYLSYTLNSDDENCKEKEEIIEEQIQFLKLKHLSNNISIEQYLKEYRKQSDSWACHFSRLHIKKDSNKNVPTMDKILGFIKEIANSGGKVFKIFGKQKYYKLFSHGYNYEIEITPLGETIIRLKVQFDYSKAEKKDIQNFHNNLKSAVEIWNNSLPQGFRLEVNEVVEMQDRNYKVQLKSKFANAVYDSYWPSFMDDTTYAHEISHMLGINEEYSVVRTNVLGFISRVNKQDKKIAEEIVDLKQKKFFLSDVDLLRTHQCFLNSISCLASNENMFYEFSRFNLLIETLKPTIMPYHFYNILRRLPIE